ncbi:MAG: DsbA family protein [Halocynthiibacter sp.]
MKRFVLAWLIALVAAFPASADHLSDDDIKQLALEAILDNPQVIMDAVAILQQREQEAAAEARAATLLSQRLLLEQDPNAPVLGNPEGDVTIVEFFDYNCPYCKQVAPEIEALIAADSNVRVVYREWPILSEGSVFAARAALAARVQGKYVEFHWALMGLRGRAEEASVLRVARSVGLDIDRLRADMESPVVAEHIQTSMDLADSLGFRGTPSFVIGQQTVPGFIPQTELEKFVAQARATQ